MTRTLTLSGFRISAAADTGLRATEEVVTERSFTVGELWKFQAAATTTPGDTYTVANIPDMTNLRFIYIENHSATSGEDLLITCNVSGPTATVTWNIAPGGVLLLADGVSADGELISIVIMSAAGAPQYTMILGDDA